MTISVISTPSTSFTIPPNQALVVENLGPGYVHWGRFAVDDSHNEGIIQPSNTITFFAPFGPVIYLACDTPTQVNTSFIPFPQSAAMLGTDGTLGGPSGSPLSPSVVSDSSGDTESPILTPVANRRNRALRDWRSLKEYDLLASGSDWTAAFNAMMTDLSAGQIAHIPGSASAYGVTSKLTIPKSLRFVGDGPGSSIVNQAYDGTVFETTGSQGSGVSLTADALQGTTTITVSSGTGLAVGQLIRIWSNQAWVGAVNGATHGEIAKIRSVSGTTVTLEAPLGDTYYATSESSVSFTCNTTSGSPTLSSVSSFTGVVQGLPLTNANIPAGLYVQAFNTSAATITLGGSATPNASGTATGTTVTGSITSQVQVLTPLDGLEFSGFTIQNPNPHTLNSAPYAIHASLTRGFKSEDMQFVGLDGAAFQLGDCIDFAIYRPDFRDLTNDPGNNRFGYGVNVNNACLNGLVHGLRMDRGRHAFTTNGGAGGGVPRHITVAHSFARHGMDPVSGNNEAAFDTHPEGEFIEFDTCHVEETQGYAFKTRCPYTKFTNCSARAVLGAGIYLQQENGQGFPHHCIIDGGFLRDIGAFNGQAEFSGVSGRGVVAEGDNATIRNLTVLNSSFEGIYIGNPANSTPNQNSEIINCQLINVGQSASCLTGINYQNSATSAGHRIRDTRVEGNSSQNLTQAVKADTNVTVTIQGLSTGFCTADIAGAGSFRNAYMTDAGIWTTNAQIQSTATIQTTGALRAVGTSSNTCFFDIGKQTGVPATPGANTARLYVVTGTTGLKIGVISPSGATYTLLDNIV